MKDFFTSRIRDLHLLKRGEPIPNFERILVDRMIDGKHVIEPNSKNIRISELFKTDINNIYYLNFSLVRPVIGTFGSGKSMTLKQAAMLIESRVKNACVAFIELTKYGGNTSSTVIIQVYKEIIDNICDKLRECIQNNKDTIKDIRNKRLLDGLTLLLNKNDNVQNALMILKGDIHENYGELSHPEALIILEELIELLGKNKYLLVLLFDELERFMTISDEKTKQAFIGTYLRAITDKTTSNYTPKIYVIFTCDKEKFEEISLIVPEVERTIREYVLYLNEFSEDEFFEVSEKIYNYILAPFKYLINIDPPTPGLCAMIIRDIDNYTPSELVTKLASYYIKNYNLDATYLLSIEKEYKKMAFEKFTEKLQARGYSRDEIKRNIRYRGLQWDAIGIRSKIRGEEVLTVGQFTILEVSMDYVEDFLAQLLLLRMEEKKHKKDAKVNAILIAPGFASGVEDFCIQNGIQWIQFYEKPKKVEKWEGIVMEKQVNIPKPIKISSNIPETKKDRQNELRRILNSLTATKIREIAKKFRIKKIYGVKKAVLINQILQELPDKIEEEISKLK
ncbi:MAG: hypothetical protein ACTSRP_04725 [Candidatus Helarchaeota archaeon]